MAFRNPSTGSTSRVGGLFGYSTGGTLTKNYTDVTLNATSVYIGGLVGGVFASMAVGVPEKNTTSEKASGCVLMLIYLAFIIYMAFFIK